MTNLAFIAGNPEPTTTNPEINQPTTTSSNQSSTNKLDGNQVITITQDNNQPPSNTLATNQPSTNNKRLPICFGFVMDLNKECVDITRAAL